MSTEEGEYTVGNLRCSQLMAGICSATAEVMSSLGLSAGVFVPLFIPSSQK